MKITYITLLGQDYPLCFSLAASAKLSDAFGGLDKLDTLLQSEDVGKTAKAVDTLLNALMDAGQTYCRMAHIDAPEPLKCNPSDLLDMTDPAALSAVLAAITAGNKRDVETVDSKNREATPEK